MTNRLSDADREWLRQQWAEVSTETARRTPSEWAEQKRYLPPSASPIAGNFRFSVTPYLREILDCLGTESPIREITFMKGAQLGGTSGVLENAIGYYIDDVQRSPMMLVTADADLAQIRLESFILPMLHQSGLATRIKSSDIGNSRKTGKAGNKLEWYGGGFLLLFGAQNPDKLRSVPVRVLLRDEIDAWPDTVGKDGDPLKLSAARTANYEATRKILDISTPLVRGTSKIAERFERGDQRRYFVCCLRCGFSQVLRWQHVEQGTGVVSGIAWETEGERLVPESVRYLCQNCGHAHTNDDKTRLFAPENGAQWRPTAEPASPHHRSYHLSALYSPVGMQTWAACALAWLEAWDVALGRSRDNGKLQVFYNNILGQPFEVRGEKLKFETVSPHRRSQYRFGEVPNNALALPHCGSPVLVITCAVDVHKTELPCAVFGWCRDRRAILVDYWRFEGDAEQLDDAGTWGRLRELLDQREYVADDGKHYRPQLTLIDSGYLTDQAYQFAAEYDAGVYPVKGREFAPKNATVREFSAFATPLGINAYGITVDLYKERWAAALRRQWDGIGVQPFSHFNAPADVTDKQLRELTVEVKRARKDSQTGRAQGFEWHRPSGAANELWDLLVYSNAALDLIAWDVCRNQLGLDAVHWGDFYERCERHQLFFEAA